MLREVRSDRDVCMQSGAACSCFRVVLIIFSTICGFGRSSPYLSRRRLEPLIFVIYKSLFVFLIFKELGKCLYFMVVFYS